jgi:RNA polymerase sigma-70 factor (ECF subfamily)
MDVSGFDPRLVEQARAGDAGAFSALVEGRWDGLVRLARSVVGEAEAEDAVQDGLIVAWRKLLAVREPAAFPAWLSRVVLRSCLRRARRRRLLRLLLSIAEVPEPAVESDPGGGVEVARLLARLAPRQRAVLHLTAVEGMSDGEIAGLLGITAGSVRAHRRRAREQLTRILDGGPR